ncbi:TIGR03016 family PEP-CTERM system-associated outer membrane protein [Halorhodospira neutriphila]|nr:TIGR03016 family PEP-CTERM system-associated outer membrane protein [Halorhodospira neutriphila]
MRWIGRLGAVALTVPAVAAAETDWEFTPRVTLGAELTDNVAFAPRGEEQGDLMGLIRPGFTLSGESSRATLDLEYSWESRFHQERGDLDRSRHRLRGQGRLELLRQTAFVEGYIRRDVRADAPLQPIGPENERETTRYRISPFLLTRYGAFAEQELRYIFDEIRYHGTERADQADLRAHRGRYRLSSGRAFDQLFWSLTAEASENRFDEERRRPIERVNTEATAGYRVARSLRLGASAGQGWNRVGDGPRRDTDSWSVNADWSPSRATTLNARYGEVTFEIPPETVTRERRSLTLRHRRQRATFSLSYRERVTDWPELERQVEVELDELLDLPRFGDDFTVSFLRRSEQDVSFTETWLASWRYETGRSTFGIGLLQREVDERIAFGQAGQERVDRDRRIDGLWRWGLGPYTDAILRGAYTRTDGTDRQGREVELDEWRTSVGLARDFGRRTRGIIEYRYRASERIRPRERRQERRENLISARVTMEF